MVRTWLVPLLLAGALAACDSGAVNPGIVNTSTGGPVSQAPPNSPAVGATGRVVSINEVALRGAGGPPRVGNGTMQGGLLGGVGGSIVGAAISNSVGGSLIGLVLGAVGGAIAGTIIESGGNSGPGIEVTVQTDAGQTVTVAQRDDGDVQLGDRVQIVQDGRGVAKVMRENSRTVDRSQAPAPNYAPTGQGAQGPRPQDDPRLGTLN